jgi:hypothetical protein
LSGKQEKPKKISKPESFESARQARWKLRVNSANQLMSKVLSRRRAFKIQREKHLKIQNKTLAIRRSQSFANCRPMENEKCVRIPKHLQKNQSNKKKKRKSGEKETLLCSSSIQSPVWKLLFRFIHHHQESLNPVFQNTSTPKNPTFLPGMDSEEPRQQDGGGEVQHWTKTELAMLAKGQAPALRARPLQPAHRFQQRQATLPHAQHPLKRPALPRV